MLRRSLGCKNLHYAIRTEDETGKVTYGAPKRLRGLQEISTTNQYSEFSFYSDDSIDESGKSLAGAEVSLTLKGLDAEDEAALMGKTYENGVLTTTVDDQQKSVALMYEITTMGKSYYRVLYNVKLAKDELNSTTKTESVESDDVTLSGMAIAGLDRVMDRIVDAEVTGTEAIVAGFFTNVYEPTVGI